MGATFYRTEESKIERATMSEARPFEDPQHTVEVEVSGVRSESVARQTLLVGVSRFRRTFALPDTARTRRRSGLSSPLEATERTLLRYYDRPTLARPGKRTNSPR